MVNKILKGVAKVVLSDVEHKQPELHESRMEICKACPNFNSESKRCMACGCFMEIKCGLTTNMNPVNQRIEFTHCPVGRWGDLHLTNYYRQIDGLPLLAV